MDVCNNKKNHYRLKKMFRKYKLLKVLHLGFIKLLAASKNSIFNKNFG